MTEVEPYHEQPGSKMNINRYATKKTIAQGMLDIALLTANASQLKYVLQTNGNHPFYTLMISLISVSLILQVLSGVLALSLNALQDCRLHILENKYLALFLNQFQLYSSFLVTGVTSGMSILYIGTLNINKEKDRRKADILNNIITIQIFVISVVNVIISSFGIEQVNIQQAKQAARMKQSEASRLTLEPSNIVTNISSNSGQMTFDDSRL